ncbi:SGNH/GDSL hydrolase family protein [Nonomuraea sp. NPDC049400]|uniref:SGNH/GDSL hydrolase family protein n=1 Tax=Nonomuraea sp. NPDC049400 TaxID=3364352 RepID=UPI0037AD6E98
MRPVRVIAVLAALVMAVATPGVAAAAPLTSSDRDAGVRTRVHTAGRVEADGDSLKYSWPGVYFEGNFRGTGVGIVLNDAAADYDIQIDGTTVTTLVTPGQTTHWVRGLRKGVHRVRVVKRSESPWATSEFGGFVAVPHGAILAGPTARHRQIEFIGDSFTAGYGNMSTTRECTGDQVNRTTNADLSFGAITARRLNADYQINAYSGRGMVRNYNGSEPQSNFRTFYDRALLSVEGDVWQNPGTWRPQLVLIGLGINDFSTAINPGEQWTPETLVAAYRTAYHAFLDKLRSQYGRDPIIVVSATHMSNTTVFAELAQQIVQERNSRGDDRIRFWYYPETGLDYGGCHWHPSAHDHRLIADRLGDFIATLPLRWWPT